jgi:anhydro-N-acetylmuramic acid kinase
MELTAVLIAKACSEYGARECYVCGGGAFNHQLMKRLVSLMPGAKVATTAALGMPPDAVEAVAFAWLARQRMLEQPANLPAVTGATGLRILGAVYPAPCKTLS